MANEIANIMLVLRGGGDFHFRDVELLASRIRQQQKNPLVKVHCLVDTISKPIQLTNVKLLPLPHLDWPGWWAKMNLFAPELEEYRPFLFMDLDTACVGDMSPLLPPKVPHDLFIMLRDFHRPRHTASALMWIPKGGKTYKIWDEWSKNPKHHMRNNRGDQDFIESVVHPDLIWQKIASRHVHSFKPHRIQWLTSIPAKTSLVCFHGKPRIWEAAEQVQWVRKYVEEGLPTREKPETKCVVNTERWDAWPYARPWFSLLCPTRGRPDMASRFLDSALASARWPDRVEILFYIDHDDPKLYEYLEFLPNSPCKVIVGPSQGVGKAWNVLARASDGEYLMMVNDDLFYETENWDQKVLHHLVKFPDGVALAYCNDGINGERQCAFPIVGRRWLEELNQFVPEKYKFFRHDTEVHDIAKQIGDPSRVIYVAEVMVRHLHHSLSGIRDETTQMNRNDNQNNYDREVYDKTVNDRRTKGRRLRKAIEYSDHFNGNVFRRLVSGKRVALVGPSPHLVEKGLGSHIESYDVVCRVNELFPLGLELDYGTRSDVVFYGCNTANYPNFEKVFQHAKEHHPERLSKLKMFMITQRRKDSSNIMSQRQFIRYLEDEQPGTTIGMISLDYWNFYHRWVLTHPNTGILALCMLAQAKPSELFLTGFSFYSQGLEPEQRHHSAYIEWGGDEAYNKTVLEKGHDQETQRNWFIEHFVPYSKDFLVVDSYLADLLSLDKDVHIFDIL